MNLNWKAIGWGLLAYVTGHFGYLVLVNLIDSFSSYMSYLLFTNVIVGGAITGRLSPTKLIVHLIIAGVLMGVSAGGINYLYWLLGYPADFGGTKGLLIVISFTVPFFVLLSLVGGAFGSKDEDRQTLNK